MIRVKSTELGRRHRRDNGSIHLRGPPTFICSDNGSKFVAEAMRDWISAVGAKTVEHRTEITAGKRLNARASTPGSGMNCSTARSLRNLKEAQIVI